MKTQPKKILTKPYVWSLKLLKLALHNKRVWRNRKFIEIQKRQDLPVNFKDGDVFIKLPRDQITSVDILFVGQSKEEIGAFQTNKYLQYPFLINTDCSQRYPNDNFLSWVSVRIDIGSLN